MRKLMFIAGIMLAVSAAISVGEEIYYEPFELLEPILPTSIYVGGSGNEGGGITGMAGIRWNRGRYAGVGLEYRHLRPKVTFARRGYTMKAHAGALYLYLETPRWNNLFAGIDLGAGVVWDDSDLDIGETWAASGRVNLGLGLSKHTELVLWGGAIRLGSFRVSAAGTSGVSPEQTVEEAGMAFRLRFK